VTPYRLHVRRMLFKTYTSYSCQHCVVFPIEVSMVCTEGLVSTCYVPFNLTSTKRGQCRSMKLYQFFIWKQFCLPVFWELTCNIAGLKRSLCLLAPNVLSRGCQKKTSKLINTTNRVYAILQGLYCCLPPSCGERG
jgi:hypothetical protein